MYFHTPWIIDNGVIDTPSNQDSRKKKEEGRQRGHDHLGSMWGGGGTKAKCICRMHLSMDMHVQRGAPECRPRFELGSVDERAIATEASPSMITLVYRPLGHRSKAPPHPSTIAVPSVIFARLPWPIPSTSNSETRHRSQQPRPSTRNSSALTRRTLRVSDE